MHVLKLNNISYRYSNKSPWVIKNLTMEFDKGKVYGIVGPSGVGKTTLLSLLSNLTKPMEGEIYYNEEAIDKINSYYYRSNLIGVVFQGYNLLPQLNALENVELSLDISAKKFIDKKYLATEVLERVGLTQETTKRKILKLSGGEQQRVSIARALSYEPEVILADEPTGNLDQKTQKEVIDIFKRIAYEENKCVIIVTHSPEVAAEVDVIYELELLNKSK